MDMHVYNSILCLCMKYNKNVYLNRKNEITIIDNNFIILFFFILLCFGCFKFDSLSKMTYKINFDTKEKKDDDVICYTLHTYKGSGAACSFHTNFRVYICN